MTKPKSYVPPDTHHRSEILHSMAERSNVQALRDLIAEMPDPVEYAMALPDQAVMDLMASQHTKGGRKAAPETLKRLRRMGLCDFKTTMLTGFGMKVYQALAGDFGE